MSTTDGSTIGNLSEASALEVGDELVLERSGVTRKLPRENLVLPVPSSWVVSSPAVGRVFGVTRVQSQRTIVRIDAITDTGTVDLNVEHAPSPGGTRTDVLSSDLTVTAAGVSVTSGFDSAIVPAGGELTIDISAIGGSPTQVALTVTYE